MVGASHFIGKYGLLQLLSGSGFTFLPFQSEPLSAFPDPRKAVISRKPTEAEEGIIQAENKKKEVYAPLQQKATTQVNMSLRHLPKIFDETGGAKDASSIKAELINAMARLLISKPTGNLLENRSFLKIYIETRNEIYADREIKDKKKAMDILEKNPHFDIKQVRDELQ